MTDPVAPPPEVSAIAPIHPAPIDWAIIARWVAAAGLAGAVLALELTGHADKGTFLNYVAVPGLTFLGLHTAAKGLN